MTTTDTATPAAAPNKTHLLQWARALESGDYKQGEGVLKNTDDEYCCLGVACDIAAEAVGGRWEISRFDSQHYAFSTPGGSREIAYLPNDVAKWLGIDINPELDGNTATNHNDLLTNSFAKIAAAIRHEFDLPTKEQDEHRLAWIKALESGEYEQGSRRLQNATGFCCLGVACDIAKDAIGGRWEAVTKDDIGRSEEAELMFSEGVKRYVIKDTKASSIAFLPIQVAEWFGFTGNLAHGLYDDPRLNGMTASNRNDVLHNSFAEIAAAARIEFGYPTLEEEINQHRLQWIEALESGDYAQVGGKLKEGNAYCCLGVACEVAKKDVNGKWLPSSGVPLENEAFVAPGDSPRTGVMPFPVAKWLGLSVTDPRLDGVQASARNDELNNTFAEIAAAARVEFGFPPKA